MPISSDANMCLFTGFSLVPAVSSRFVLMRRKICRRVSRSGVSSWPSTNRSPCFSIALMTACDPSVEGSANGMGSTSLSNLTSWKYLWQRCKIELIRGTSQACFVSESITIATFRPRRRTAWTYCYERLKHWILEWKAKEFVKLGESWMGPAEIVSWPPAVKPLKCAVLVCSCKSLLHVIHVRSIRMLQPRRMLARSNQPTKHFDCRRMLISRV